MRFGAKTRRRKTSRNLHNNAVAIDGICNIINGMDRKDLLIRFKTIHDKKKVAAHARLFGISSNQYILEAAKCRMDSESIDDELEKFLEELQSGSNS